MTGTAMDHELIVTRGLGNATHLLAVGDEAIVVDPPRDAWRVQAVAARRGWRIRRVLETHVHNDYLSGALELRAAMGVEIVAPAGGGYAFAHRGVEAGDELRLGDVRLVARATPGHTPEHLAWDVIPDGAPAPRAVLTGGSLLVGSVGRTDLLGAAMLDELTDAQAASLRDLAALPDDVAILPTHGAGSFCSAGPVDAPRTSTIGHERRANPLLIAVLPSGAPGATTPDAASVRRSLTARLAPYPTYYGAMAGANRAGPAVLGAAPRPPARTPTELIAALDAGGVLVDARPRAAVAAGHIPGALGIELDDSFGSYVGWHVPVGRPIVLVLPDPVDEALPEAVDQLIRIGYDRLPGWLDGGLDGWAAAGGAIRSYPTLTADALAAELAAGSVPGPILDVRDPDEARDEGRLDGALPIPHWALADRLGELPRDVPITVACRSGARAAIAASRLDAAGLAVRLVAAGGIPDVARR